MLKMLQFKNWNLNLHKDLKQNIEIYVLVFNMQTFCQQPLQG